MNGLFPETALAFFEFCFLLTFLSNMNLFDLNIKTALFKGLISLFFPDPIFEKVADSLNIGYFKVVIAHHLSYKIG